MELTIEQNCPSCGASIVLSEDDRLIRCEYCDVNNYRLESGEARYMLPGKQPDYISPDQLFYTPYLRFKGTIFYVRGGEVGHKIVDTTRLGIEEEKIPASLGLRPQAMKLSPVVASREGLFLQQTVATQTAFIHAAMVAELFNKNNGQSVYHRAFIGETLSRIYQPCYLHAGILYDAVLNKPLGSGQWLENYRGKQSVAQASWEPQFISTTCPTCSALLEGERDGLVLRCDNCQTLWQEKQGRFQTLSWQVIPSLDASALYLPFWHISFSTTGTVLASFGDYLRFTNQPMLISKKFDAMPLSFLIPAFKLNPKIFLQVASQFTVSQWRIPDVGEQRLVNDYPVTLSHTEAIQAIKIVLAATTLNKNKKLPLLPQMNIVTSGCRLTYLPFKQQAHDFVEEHTSIALLAAALRFGRKL